VVVSGSLFSRLPRRVCSNRIDAGRGVASTLLAIKPINSMKCVTLTPPFTKERYGMLAFKSLMRLLPIDTHDELKQLHRK
jgi:hypothetical protein